METLVIVFGATPEGRWPVSMQGLTLHASEKGNISLKMPVILVLVADSAQDTFLLYLSATGFVACSMFSS
jgi:hypothetical protein